MMGINDSGKCDEVKDGKVAVEDSPFPLTDIDRWVLSQTDEEFHLHTWDELKEIIGEHIYSCVQFHLAKVEHIPRDSPRPTVAPICLYFPSSLSLSLSTIFRPANTITMKPQIISPS